MQTIKSSTIDVCGYDQDPHKLRVTFKDQPTQDFCHVPEQLCQQLLNSSSKSRFFKRHLQRAVPC